jgi:hypothetical protein
VEFCRIERKGAIRFMDLGAAVVELVSLAKEQRFVRRVRRGSIEADGGRDDMRESVWFEINVFALEVDGRGVIILS